MLSAIILKRKLLFSIFTGKIQFLSTSEIQYPDTINEDRKNRALLLISWMYYNKLTNISEEKLVYDSRDLLAWIGGALGIFVGYSFFDLAKHIIDIVFHFIYRAVRTN